MKLERISVPQASTAEDYNDNPTLYRLLKRLPPELASLHIAKMESEGWDDKESEEYLESILKRREDATRISEVSDESLRNYFVGREEEIFAQIEGSVYRNPENSLGSGMTAKVKAYLFQTPEIEIPMAVKYLVTPTPKTLSAQGEHDLIKEVERIQQIEVLERKDAELLKHIRVPHPYFHHKNRDIQCYGMELIQGVTLEQGMEKFWKSSEVKERIKKALEGIDLEEIFQEVEVFFDNMHELCLHGDIKPGNIMVDVEGTFAVIDFGQSILTNSISDKERDAFETLKEDEKKMTKDAIRRFFLSLNE